MSDTKASTAKSSKADSGKSDSGSSTKKDSAAAKDSASKTESSGKSARESVGGAKEVHYGYFSNVKTPEYLDGWDAIWGNKKGGGKKKSAAKKKPAARKPLAPVQLRFDLDDLPVEVRDGLVAAAKAELKKSRVNYDKRDAAGSVDWQIECWVKRA